MKVKEFIEKLNMVCSDDTLYVLGAFGAPLTDKAKDRYMNAQQYNRQPSRAAKIEEAKPSTFAFDCCGLIKGILWGWSGKFDKTYGGASYKANGVPDLSADGIARECGTRTDWENIEPGCFVYMPGHIGVYIGDGYVIESSPKWRDGVQKTALANIGCTDGHRRTWDAWGYLDWVEYDGAIEPPVTPIYETYTVKRGDNLTRIAKAYGTTVTALVKENDIANKNHIRVGQILRIKVGGN